MLDFKLNDQSKASIERVTGIRYEDILTMDIPDLNAAIEKKIGKKLKHKPFNNSRLIGRGCVYLYLNRIFDFDTEKMDRYIDKL